MDAKLKTTVITAARPALRISHADRRRLAREHEIAPVKQIGRFDPRKQDPRKFALLPRALREAAARAHAAGRDPEAAKAALTPPPVRQALARAATEAPLFTPTLNPPPLQPLVPARPLVRAGGEDYRQHPSRLTPAVREAYWGDHPPPDPERK